MKNSIDILNELKELSPTLAAMEKLNVFTVPDGYFAQLESDILMGINNEYGLNKEASISSVADVPQGYFDTLADSILTKIKAQQQEDAATEISALSPVLSGIKNNNVFEVPGGYFDGLADSVLAKIKTPEQHDAATEISVLSPVLSGIKNKNVFEVPAGYFNTLADSVLAKITTPEQDDASTEISVLSPMLYSIQNENVFEVPQGYFENLHDEVLDKVKSQPKVITMRSRSATFFKYAVAAAFTGMMALGVFKFTDNTKAKFVEPEYVTIGKQIKDVDKELATISDDEIVKFLEAGGTDIKAAYVANSTDKNELPSQEDYLLDDQALDKYLNSINLDDLKN